MARIVGIGFESGSLLECAATSGSPTISSSTYNTGAYSLNCNPVTTGTVYATIGGWNGPIALGSISVANGYYKAFVNFSALPTSSEEFLSLWTSAPGLKFALRINSDGTIAAYASDGTTLLGTSSTALQTGLWYRIEFYVQSSVTGQYEVRIGGTTEISGTGNLSATAAAYLRLGKVTNRNNYGYNCYFDDISIDNSVWCGDTVIKALTPDGDSATDVGWTLGAGASKNAAVAVRPLTTDDSNYIYTSTTDGVYSAQLSAATGNVGAAILAVTVWGVVKRVGSSGATTIRLRQNSTTYNDSSSMTLGTSYTAAGKIHTAELVYGVSFTLSDLDSMEVGITSSNNKEKRCCQLLLFVEYVTGSTVPLYDRVMMTGFEAGDITECYSAIGTYAIVTSPVHTGTYSLQCNPTTTAAGAVHIGIYNPTVTYWSKKRAWIKFHFRIGAIPVYDNEEFMAIEDSTGGLCFSLRVSNKSGGHCHVQVWDNTGTQVGSNGTTTLVEDTWYSIRVSLTSGTSGAFEVYIDDTQEFSSTGNWGTNSWYYLVLGKHTNRFGNTVNFYYDDVIVGNLKYPDKDAAITALIPTSDGPLAEWDASSGDPYACVNETPNTGDTNYISTSTSGERHSFHTTTCSAAGITDPKSVMVYSIQRGTATTTAGVLWEQGSIIGTLTSAAVGTSYVTVATILTRNPKNGGDWSVTALDTDVHCGVYCGAAVATRCTNFKLMVEHIPVQVQTATAGIATVTAAGIDAAALQDQVATCEIALATASGLIAEGLNPYTATGDIAAVTASGIDAGAENPHILTAEIAAPTAQGIDASVDQPQLAIADIALTTAYGLDSDGTNPYTDTVGISAATAEAISATAENTFTDSAEIASATAAGIDITIIQPQVADTEIALATAAAYSVSADVPQSAETIIASTTVAGLIADATNVYSATAEIASATAAAIDCSVENIYSDSCTIAVASVVGLDPSQENTYSGTVELALAIADGLSAQALSAYSDSVQIATLISNALDCSAGVGQSADAIIASSQVLGLEANETNPFLAIADISQLTASGLDSSAENLYSGNVEIAAVVVQFLQANGAVGQMANAEIYSVVVTVNSTQIVTVYPRVKSATFSLKKPQTTMDMKKPQMSFGFRPARKS